MQYTNYKYFSHILSVLIWTLNQRASSSWQMKMAFVVVLYKLTRLHADMLHLLHMSTPLMISPLMKSLWWELTDCRMKNDNFVITNSRHFQAKKFSLLAWIITFFRFSSNGYQILTFFLNNLRSLKLHSSQRN